jgi:hypothetical protein
MLAPVVAEAPPVWDLAAEAEDSVVAVVGDGAGKTARIAGTAGTIDTGADNEIVIREQRTV